MESREKEIIELRKNGLSFREIAKELRCSQSTVSKWCNKNDLGDIGLGILKRISKELANEINEYYKEHTKKETALKFKISEVTVLKYSDKKKIVLNDLQLRNNLKNGKLNRRIKIKLNAIEYKGGKCEICGYDKCRWALDFHHKNKDEKEFSIGSSYNISWERIKNELDKCILICSNCHREIHFNELNLKENN